MRNYTLADFVIIHKKDIYQGDELRRQFYEDLKANKTFKLLESTDYKIVRNESGLNRNLIDKVGYIVLSGKCETYGGGRFVSAYKLSTG